MLIGARLHSQEPSNEFLGRYQGLYEDLVLVLEGHLSFRDTIDTNVKSAQTKGLIYVHPITGEEKVSGGYLFVFRQVSIT